MISHIRAEHSTYLNEIQEAKKSEDRRIQSKLPLVTNNAKNIFGWLDWIVTEYREFSFCEKPLVHKSSCLNPITRPPLQKYSTLLTKKVEEKIVNALPEEFGLIVDGWSCRTTHYLAVFASYLGSDGYQERPLLAFSPLLEAEDMSAQSHKAFIATMLNDIYHCDQSRIVYFVGDNCAMNKLLASFFGVPLIGCASHRLSLAINHFVKQEGRFVLIERVYELMKKLRTLKYAAKLRFWWAEKANGPALSAIIRNETRWSSTYFMITRYFQLLPVLDVKDDGITSFLLSPEENKRLEKLQKELMQFESVTKVLQSEEIDLGAVRCLFDGLIECHPELSHHIGADADIIQSKDFENAVVKVLNLEDKKLNAKEKHSLSGFKRSAPGSDVEILEIEESVSFAKMLLMERQSKSGVRSEYTDLRQIPSTSNRAERVFSTAKLITTDQRNRISPTALEETLFLKVNRKFWDFTTVSQVIINEKK